MTEVVEDKQPAIFGASHSFLRTQSQNAMSDLDPHAHAAVDHAFGFGRRMCPGRFMAYGFVWITMAGVLAAFDVEKPRDENGRVIQPSGKYSGGILGYARSLA